MVTYILVAILSLFNLVGTNALATQGVVLNDTVKKTQDLIKANQQLLYEINQLSNLETIHQQAENQGFYNLKSVVLLPAPAPVAASTLPSNP